MKTIIGIIEKSKFVEENYNEILRGHFVEFTSARVEYMKIITFEKYAMTDQFDYVFYSEEDLQAWVKEVPLSISKLQALSHLLTIGRYEDLMSALNADETGIKKILFDAAHQLDRASTMVNEMAVVLGMTDEDLDNFFIEASKILV